MTDPCPNNSTECLLRAILEADSGYNWDPATFGFTVVFTVIAFIVSVVALLQSLVAAGPGRLKASERAIGVKQHQQRADTQFSWKEFRFRTIVDVPVIDVAKILAHNATVIAIDGKGYDEQSDVVSNSRVVAGWSQLLNDLSLTDVDFNTIQCLTDYVPGDIPAAPAYARVESIILLCIMKGCTRLLKNEEGFISAVGPSAQLSWNMHPTLGAMAIYQTWDVRDTSKHLLLDVQRMIPIFLGQLYLSGITLYKPLPQRRNDIPVSFDADQLRTYCARSWSHCRHQHENCYRRKHSMWISYLTKQNKHGQLDKKIAAFACVLFADRPSTTQAFPTRITELQPALKKMYDEYFPWLILADDLDDHILSTLCGSLFVEFDDWDLGLDHVQIKDCQTTSWMVGAAGYSAAKPDSSFRLQRPGIHRPDSIFKSSVGKTTYQKTSYDKIQSSGIRISRSAVRHLSRWLSDDTYFGTASPTELCEMKKWLVYQLAELDWYLSNTGDDGICAACNLVTLSTTGIVRFTKLQRRHVMPETLDAFNLSWIVNPNDVGTIIVRDYLDQETIQKLFSYTKNYIERHRPEIHTVECPSTDQGFYYTTKKCQSKAKTGEKRDGQKATVADALAESRKESSDSSATKNVQDGAGHANTDAQTNLEKGLENSYSYTDDTAKATPKFFPPEAAGDAEFREWLVEENRRREESREPGSTDDEVRMRVDDRIASLEALMFFRAGIFGALLATGTDTSDILTLENRYQLVQVQ